MTRRERRTLSDNLIERPITAGFVLFCRVMLSFLIHGWAVWLLLLIVAVLNGAARQAVLIPRFGEQTGHVISTLILTLAIFAVGWLLFPWLSISTHSEAWLVGGLWLTLTVAFEFLAGHFLFKAPWSKLLADYDVMRGRIWLLVLIVTALTPWLVLRIKS